MTQWKVESTKDRHGDQRTKGYFKGHVTGEIKRHEAIVDYLRSYGKKSFSEIKKYLKDKGIPYATDYGLVLGLTSLIRKDRIGKTPGKKPVYYLKNTETDNIILQAQEFKRLIFHKASTFPTISKHKNESVERYFLRNIIHQYGIYTLFVEMQSWNYTSNKKDHSYNHNMRGMWLRNVLPLGIESKFFEDGIKDLCNLQFHNSTTFDESISKIYASQKKWKKFKELEKTFKKKYPKEFSFFDEILKKSPEGAKQTKEWIKSIQSHETWKKNVIRRNKKKPKMNLKPNQCPYCYYDGTTKVKGGEAKGRKYPAGYVNEYTDQEGEHWHCAACGYWETKKIG